MIERYGLHRHTDGDPEGFVSDATADNLRRFVDTLPERDPLKVALRDMCDALGKCGMVNVDVDQTYQVSSVEDVRAREGEWRWVTTGKGA